MTNGSPSWKAYRLDISKEVDTFTFIKRKIVSFINERDIRFWITYYWDPRTEPNPHMWFRVHVSLEQQQVVEGFLDMLVSNGDLLRRFPAEPWDPVGDARNRIMGAKEKIERSPGFLQIPGYPPISREYLSSLNSDEERINQLASLFASIGECTKVFYNSLDEKPVDPYVMSLALHILLNSLTFSGPSAPSEEFSIRGFPVI